MERKARANGAEGPEHDTGRHGPSSPGGGSAPAIPELTADLILTAAAEEMNKDDLSPDDLPTLAVADGVDFRIGAAEDAAREAGLPLEVRVRALVAVMDVLASARYPKEQRSTWANTAHRIAVGDVSAEQVAESPELPRFVPYLYYFAACPHGLPARDLVRELARGVESRARPSALRDALGAYANELERSGSRSPSS